MPSRNTDPALLPAHAMSAAIGAGRLSPVEIVEAALARIAAADGKLHAFVEVYDKEARLAAEAADKAIRSGHRIGPLHGIPIALKDLIEIEGRVTTGGSQVWRDRRSAYTATLAQRLIAAG
ncbi:MAG: amidase family protein, partial [Stellaceae bacterium]